MANCEHFDAIDVNKYRHYDQCTDCVLFEHEWVNLRTCMYCGDTRCCDSSPNKHATKHAISKGHPVTLLLESNILWCYDHEITKKLS